MDGLDESSAMMNLFPQSESYSSYSGTSNSLTTMFTAKKPKSQRQGTKRKLKASTKVESCSISTLIGKHNGEVSPPILVDEKKQRRKRARTDAEKEERAEERKIKNRQSAMRSRQRVLNELQKDKDEITELKQENSEQAILISQLRTQVQQLTAQLQLTQSQGQTQQQPTFNNESVNFDMLYDYFTGTGLGVAEEREEQDVVANVNCDHELDDTDCGLGFNFGKELGVGEERVRAGVDLYNEKASFFGDCEQISTSESAAVIMFSRLLERSNSILRLNSNQQRDLLTRLKANNYERYLVQGNRTGSSGNPANLTRYQRRILRKVVTLAHQRTR